MKDNTRLMLKEGYRGFPDYYACPKCNYKVALIEIHNIERLVNEGYTKFSTIYSNVLVEDKIIYLEKRCVP